MSALCIFLNIKVDVDEQKSQSVNDKEDKYILNAICKDKHSFQDGQSISKSLRTEKYPADAHKEIGAKDGKCAGEMLGTFAGCSLFGLGFYGFDLAILAPI